MCPLVLIQTRTFLCLGMRETLTAKEREAVITAYEEGWYAETRGVTSSELGEMLGVSHVRVLQLLRHAERKLVENYIEDWEEYTVEQGQMVKYDGGANE